MITVSRNAIKKMNNIIKKSNNKNGFLFSIKSGGCNGFNFNLELIKNNNINNIIKQKPTIIKNNNYNIYIDPLTEFYLVGTEIDYIEENYNKGI